MNPNDIHQKEQTTAPMTKPLATNDDFANKNVPSLEHAIGVSPRTVDDTTHELAQRANAFLAPPAAPLPHGHAAPPHPTVMPKSDHRGEVKSPDDGRLSQNKHHKDPGERHEEEDEKRDQEHDEEQDRQDANKERLEHLRQIEEEQREHSLAHAAADESNNGIKTFDPSGKLPGFLEGGMTTAPAPGAKIPRPVIPKPVNTPVPQRSAPVRPGTAPQGPQFSQHEMALRNHPTFGPHVNRLLGPNPATPEKLQQLRDWFSRQTSSKVANLSVDQQNEMHNIISQVAYMQIQSGYLNKEND